jgi:hypothetical protein
MVDYDLVGVAGTHYCNEVLEVLMKKGFCWSGWTYPVSEKRLGELKQSLFRVFIYSPEIKEVSHIFHCNDIVYNKNYLQTNLQTTDAG